MWVGRPCRGRGSALGSDLFNANADVLRVLSPSKSDDSIIGEVPAWAM